MGSFLCCQARRLHRKEQSKWSVCPHCHYRLKWYDNIPIISWIMLKGRCRKCHKKIGALEILSEIGVGVALLMVTMRYVGGEMVMDAMGFPVFGAMQWCIYAGLVLLTLSLCFLAIYDGAYGELPSLALTFAGICAIMMLILQQWSGLSDVGGSFRITVDALLSALLFGGVYLVLYLVSHGKWVGDGDFIIAGIIGVALGTPWLSLIALLVANLSATIVMYPFVRKTKNHQIFFGPFLVLAFVVVYSFAPFFQSLI